ncbi:LysR family transcriptional regulator [Streptomyces sp. NPDC056244]|uniref:LysR family transcriptional regulator n=1 Tax=Streptomyces sp. NPDC056244 TaxID=3345762 RepID=UPI0035E204BB
MSVDLRLMRYVIAVADAGGFEGAAEMLHMTQPPLSRQIAALERELGVPLFHRRPTRPTEAGLVFIESARRILEDTDRAVRQVRLVGGAGTGTLRIGYTVTTAFDEMPKLFAAMREEHPGIRIDAREAWDVELSAALRDREIDVLLGRLVRIPSGHRTATLRRDPLTAVLDTGHPLAGRDALALRELRGHTLRFFPRAVAPRYHDGVLAALRVSGETFDVWENRLPGLRNLGSALSGGDFMILPASLRPHLPPTMVGVALLDELPTIDLQLAWARDAPPTVAALVRTARRLARTEGWLPARTKVLRSARTYKTGQDQAP